MSYLIQEPTTFINVKLTDAGRRLLSLGQLTFDKVGISDREIDYKIGRSGGYSICSNKTLAPKDDQPIFSTNFDGTALVDLTGQQIGSARQIISAQTADIGFFSAATEGYTFYSSWVDYGYGSALGKAWINYATHKPDGSTIITIDPALYSAHTGDLVYIPWEPIQYSAVTNDNDYIPSGRPTVALWYRVYSADTTGQVLTLDRAAPNFSAATTQRIHAHFYPYNGIDTYYGSATTINTKVWNMNIIRTSSEIGTNNSISGYTSYGSLQYNGTKRYLGFSSETRSIGVVHYSNQYTGNTYAEQLVEGTVSVTIPNIMWHKKSGALNGVQLDFGATFYDVYGSSYFDSAAETTYKELRDGTDYTSNVVGRVYHKLKMIVFTDQELLTALSYKSNRNYTLPQLNLSLTTSPKTPLTTANATGLCKSDFSYFVTYVTESEPCYISGASYGYPQALHCGYIQQVNGQNGSNGYPQFLAASFSTNSFPYMRKSTDLENGATTYSGTGWNANKIQLLVKEIATSGVTGVGDLDTDNWVLVSNGAGNGIYAGETGHLTIDPLYLQNYQFIISQQDYNSGTTYALSGKYSGFTTNCDSLSSNGLTFGNESFFFGNISAGIMATTFKSVVTIYARNTDFNSSKNPSYDGTLDANTYITEFAVFNSDGYLVGVGKPTYPILKNSSRFLAFQLEIDF